MPLDKDSILAALRTLVRREQRLAEVERPAGQTWEADQDRLNPPLDASVVEAFENQHGISLPDDYKLFITTMGNGGAGPSYGLFPLGEYDDGRKWEDGCFVGDVGQPFPFTEAWNLPQSFWDKEPNPPPGTPVEEEDRMTAAWDQILDEQYFAPQIMNGAIPLCHIGCGLYQWLVVNGVQRGYVWNDGRADHAGLSPLLNDRGEPMTFTDWYLIGLCSDGPSTNRRALATCRNYDAAELSATWRVSHYFSEWFFLSAMVIGSLPGVAIACWYDGPIWLGALATAGAALTLVAGLDRLLVAQRNRRQGDGRSASAIGDH
ncbi:MAG TPA: SMI1/KNR4 family protein [Pirellulales bacterium]|nr:SMI1/KNR4 family protein [Pirellulales bacterium]